MAEHCTRNSADLIAAEQQHIKNARQRANISDPNYSAFAISGGGIRSSSLGLGVMQALVAAGLMKKFDYLSTVSGGGYIGSALTWFLKQGLPDQHLAGVDADNFPFGRPRAGARQGQQLNTPAVHDHNAILNFIRQHGTYLTPGQGLNGWALIGLALRATLVSLTTYFLLFISAFLLLITLNIFESVDVSVIGLPAKLQPTFNNLPITVATLSLVAYIIGSFIYALSTRWSTDNSSFRYRLRTWAQISQGKLLSMGLLFFIVGLLPYTYGWLETLNAKLQAAGTLTVLGSAWGFFQRGQRDKKEKRPNIITASLDMIASGFILYGLAFGAYTIASWVLTSDYTALFSSVIVITSVILGVAVNTNYLGLHRMYRDRLMETFLPNLESVRQNRWQLSTDADIALLETMCQTPNERPYHLIGANVVLTDSLETKYRGRGGDSFLFSPLYCGSDATGWAQTSQYMKAGNSSGMTLATAMAISGASFNPNAGNNGGGLTHNRIVSTLFNLLNLRLGYWANNPAFVNKVIFKPNFLYPGIIKGGILGGHLRETHRHIELTDGGHFDNLGLYELIRRQLKLIVIVDGGADPEFRFDDLGNAVERARVDFGTGIKFEHPVYNLTNLMPSSATESDVLNDRFKLARHGFALGRIEYADGSEGKIIYVKSTLTHKQSVDIFSYKGSHPEFPHEPTADQFFNEVQFEAYRELGYYLGWAMIEACGTEESQGQWQFTI
ncbi:MAG: patatin-like phospholipase family protein [Gammaproteobacteria bacterium]|nr:patatin-like phospholipase family protein [Gammaproteobacteria bacterium]